VKSVNPDGETFTPQVSVLLMDEEQIRQRGAADPAFGKYPCDRCSHPFGEHASLKMRLTHRDGEVVRVRIIECRLAGKE
jgi:hypothetical protein